MIICHAERSEASQFYLYCPLLILENIILESVS